MKPIGKNNNFWSVFLVLALVAAPLCADPAPEETLSGENRPKIDEPLLIEEPGAAAAPALVEELIADTQAVSADVLASEEDPGLAAEGLSDEEIEALFAFEAPPLIYEVEPVIVETRSFINIFPDLNRNQRRIATGTYGFRNSFQIGGTPLLRPTADSGLSAISSYVMQKRPSHIVESLIIVPYNDKELEMLDIYNALRMIKNIQEQALPNSNDYRIFLDTTRLESAQNRRPVPDPAPATMLPYSETMYLRFTDRSIGDLYIRGDITMSLHGITYSMTNFRDINYSIFRVMGKERFSAIIYVEPVSEGIMIYCMSGLYLPDFIASRLSLSSNINNRITVFTNWIIDGLRKQNTKEEKILVPYAAN